MKSLECLQKATQEHRVKALTSLIMGNKSNFLVHTAVALSLEWASQEGDGEFDIDRFARESVADSVAELSASKAEPAEAVTDSPCEDVNTGGREE